MEQKTHAVGRFSDRLDAERALSQLNNIGFSRSQISIVARCPEIKLQFDLDEVKSNDEVVEAQKEAAAGAIAGGMLGAVIGCLIGLGMLVVPGISAMLAVRTAATAVASTLTGGGIGIAGGSLISVLATLEIIPHRSTERDGSARRRHRTLSGEYLLIVDGSNEEVLQAELILSKLCSSNVWLY